MNDYLFECGRAHALEKKLVGRERLALLLTAKDPAQAVERLAEMGIRTVTDPESGAFLREETLLGILREVYANLGETVRTAPALRLWLYPYDCNNIKAAIKARFLGIDPRGMMFDFGTVPTERVVEMVRKEQFDTLPPEMAAAAREAIEAYAKGRDPQSIDLLLDRACFADMLASARESGVRFAVELVQLRIDLINALTTVRVLRMQNGETGKRLLRSALLEGGTVTPDTLLKYAEEGEETLWKRLRSTSVGRLSDRVCESDGLTAVERSADNVFTEKLGEAKWNPCGIEALIAYLLAAESDVRNLRIVLAGISAGLSAEKIRERIRDGYV